MKKMFQAFVFVAVAALLLSTGYGLFFQDNHPSPSVNQVAGFFGPSQACAHVGGDCYLDDNNISTVESGCYRKCGTTFSSSSTERSACEVGCSMAIDVATKK